MASLRLLGRFLSQDSMKVLRGITKEAKLKDIVFDDESVEFQGSVDSIEQGLILVGARDVLDPDFGRSRFPVEFPERRVRRLLAKGKESRFEAVLEARGLKKCYGDTVWRFITPRTTMDRDPVMADRLAECRGCSEFDACSVVTLLRKVSVRED